MPLYCKRCDEFFFYNDFRGEPKLCPFCGFKLRFYRNKHDAPRGWRCCDCAYIYTSACKIGSNVNWTPEAPFYAKPCEKFTPRRAQR